MRSIKINELAQKIMLHIMRFRRIAGPKKSCAVSGCADCIRPHLPAVTFAIKHSAPITFVLPAFPAKSPNQCKVLGTLPDMAEELSLDFLNNLCKQIQAMYPPGARIILCADGRVFNDAVGIPDHDVTSYQDAISHMLQQRSFTFISTFNLDDVYQHNDFHHMRQHLMNQYGEPLTSIQDAVRRGSKLPTNQEDEEIHRQYCGITRFLVEDAMHPSQKLSRSALQKECRLRAYAVIQKSRAWSHLIEEYFPHAVRLSIHPQTCGSPKLGICLLEAESWMTPWHGVAVQIKDRFTLIKRTEAEKLGAILIYKNGKASHFELARSPIHA